MISRRQIIRHQLEEGEHQLRTASSLGANNHQLHQAARLDQFDPYSIYGEEDDEEDVWYSEDRLFEDHIQEVIDKWHSIDDEIWAKIICMERNRRIAKAYGRKHVLTINGSHDDYIDGTILGLNSFDNPDRDVKTKHIKQYIGHGVRIKIDDSGDIWVKRLSKCSVYLRKVNNGNSSTGPTNGTNVNNTNSAGNSSSSSDSYMANSSNNSDLNDFYGIVGYPPPQLTQSAHNQRHSRTNQGGALKAIEQTNGASKQQQKQQQQQQQQQLSNSKQHNNSKQQQNNGYNGSRMTTSNTQKHDQFILLNSSSGVSGSTGGSTGSSTGSSMNQLVASQNGNSKHAGGKKSSSDHNLVTMSSHQQQQQQQQKQQQLHQKNSKLLSGEINSYGSVSLDTDVAHKIFDMEAFKLALAHELRQSCPNRCKLLNCCISIISFVVDDKKLLNLPSWVMIINIVAIDLLKTELGLTDQDLLNPMTPGTLLGQPYSPTNNARYLHSNSTNLNGYNRQHHGDEATQFQHLRTRITGKHQQSRHQQQPQHHLFDHSIMADDTNLSYNNHLQHPQQHSGKFSSNLKSSLSQEDLLQQQQQHHHHFSGNGVSNGGKNGFAAARKAFADAAAAGIYNQVKLTGSTSDIMLSNESNASKNGLARYKNIQILGNQHHHHHHHQCDDQCPSVCNAQAAQPNNLFYTNNKNCNNSHSHSKHDLTNVDESSEGSSQCSLEPECCSCQANQNCLNQKQLPQNTDTTAANGTEQAAATSNNNLSSSSGFESHSSSSIEQHPLVSTSASSVQLMSTAGHQQHICNSNEHGTDTTSASIYGPIKQNHHQHQHHNHKHLSSSPIGATTSEHCECQCQLDANSAAVHKVAPKLPQRYTNNNNNNNNSNTGNLDLQQEQHHHCHHHLHHDQACLNGGGATGTASEPVGANLLLVAPTGLSPQLPTKMPHNTTTTPRFSTIQYIDGNGQCNVLHNELATNANANDKTIAATPAVKNTSAKTRTTLPPGIPAHAQLAPPATQKHILRYVMSAVKNVANGGNKQHAATASTNKQSTAVASNNHNNFISKQRPLPILPTQQQPPFGYITGGQLRQSSNHCDDEDNLYYCGLQARVPAFRRYPPQAANSTTNINAILTDINGKIVRRGGGAQQYSHQMSYHSSKHHHQQQQLLQSGAALGPKNRLLLNQLKMLSSVQHHPNSSASSSNLISNHHNSLFLSADNLNHSHRYPMSTAATNTTASGGNATKKEKKGVKLFSLSSSSSSNQSTEILASQDQENRDSSKQKSSKSTKRTKTTRKS